MIWAKVAIPLLCMALLLRFKAPLEAALPAGALILGFLFGLTPGQVAVEYVKLFGTKNYWNLFLVIFFVMLLGELMEKGRLFERMAALFLRLFRDNRMAAAASTGFIGFLPMPGGSLLSAPFVDKLLPGWKGEEKLVLNYWFRHIWEYFFPLYSGMAWIITVMKIAPRDIFFWIGPMAAVMALAGLPILLRRPAAAVEFPAEGERPYKLLIIAWPILLAVLLSIVGGLPLAASITVATLLFLAKNRRLAVHIPAFLKKPRTLLLFLMVAGIVYFDAMVRASGVATALYAELSHADPSLVVFSLSLAIGLLTGISIGFISIVFPILTPFLIHDGGVDFLLLTCAYIGGFTGVMLSPTHLCLIVTTDFFKTTLAAVYPAILRSAGLMLAGGALYYAFLRAVFG